MPVVQDADKKSPIQIASTMIGTAQVDSRGAQMRYFRRQVLAGLKAKICAVQTAGLR